MDFQPKRSIAIAIAAFTFVSVPFGTTYADETCNSPYTTALIKGQEQFLHVWTLGIKGVGDGSDKLVTVDVEPGSKNFGKVIDSVSVGGRGEAHHTGFTDDRKHLWAGRLDDNKIFVFDVGTDPSKPKLVNTINDFADKSGYVGPHTFYALPGRMMVQALSNTKDHSGVTGIAIYNNEGKYVSRHDMPVANQAIGGGDGYGYDIGINPQKNVLLTSSFTGWTNYMMDLGTMVKDAKGEWQAKDVATVGDPSKIPLPVDISLTADGKGLWVNTFTDGKTRYFDMTDPEHPKMTYEMSAGKQVNMVSQSWDGKRVYLTTSLLGNWDKKGADNEQFLKAYDWDGKKLTEVFNVDFNALKLGRAHHMKFTARTGATASIGAATTRVAAVSR